MGGNPEQGACLKPLVQEVFPIVPAQALAVGGVEFQQRAQHVGLHAIDAMGDVGQRAAFVAGLARGVVRREAVQDFPDLADFEDV